MILVPRKSTWLGNRNSQSGVGAQKLCPESVEETFGSPVTYQAQETVTAAEFPSQQLAISQIASCPRWDPTLDSIISQSTPSHSIHDEPSSLEAGVKETTKPDDESGPLPNLIPVPHMSPGLDATALTSVVHLDSKNLTLAVFERGPVNPDHPASSPDLMIYAENDQEMMRGIKKESLKLDTATISTLMSPRSPRIFATSASKVQPRPSEFTPATRRICEIVTESRSCLHDSVIHLVSLHGRKNTKRNFWKYSVDISDIDDGRMVSDPDGRENQIMKRRRLSKFQLIDCVNAARSQIERNHLLYPISTALF